tara:strand:- start:608 stop:1837 length:1230 start_codon:yes stop_codon:yes gene_type:complete
MSMDELMAAPLTPETACKIMQSVTLNTVITPPKGHPKHPDTVAIPKRPTPHRDSFYTETYPPCSFTREAVLQMLELDEPASDEQIKKAFQKRAASQTSVYLQESQSPRDEGGKRPAAASRPLAAPRVERVGRQYVDLVNRAEDLLSAPDGDGRPGEDLSIPTAVELLEKAITLHPDRASAHMNLAIAHQRADRPLDASQSFLDAMARYKAGSEKWVTACCMAYDQRCRAVDAVAGGGRDDGVYCTTSEAAGHPSALPAPPEWMSSPKDVLRMATRLVEADGEATMAWAMKAEAEEAAGELQEAARSYMKATALCKAKGDAANQAIFTARARDVLARLKEINQSSVSRLKGAGPVNQSGEPLITIVSDPKQPKTFVEDAVDAIKRRGLEVPADMQRQADEAARERAAQGR